MAEQRDIDVVLITGAGASRDLSTIDPFPLMGEWSASLEKHLADAGFHILEAVGIRGIKDGHEFETLLGGFLQQVQAFRKAESLMYRTRNFPGTPQAMADETVIKDWFSQVDHVIKAAVDAIHESLVTEFGKRRVNTTIAHNAYSTLLEALHVRPGSNRWVYATTNYDRNGELVLADLGYRPDWGGDSSPHIGAGTYGSLYVNGLATELGTRRVPVLHLHGCVGWFSREDESAYFGDPGSTQQMPSDVPLIMLPDPDKRYEGIDLITRTWEELRAALRRAQAVFVLGHSLQDESLVEAIRDEVQPVSRIAIGVLGPNDNVSVFGPGGQEVADRAIAAFGDAVRRIPIRFGGEITEEAVAAISFWKGTCEQLEA